jgi:anti-sigma-K factor RskA
MTITPPGPDDPHILLGAYILGGLSNEEHREFSRHLETCEACRAEAARFSGIPSILEKARPEAELEPPAAPPVSNVADLFAERRRRRARGRIRTGLVASVLMAASIGVGIGIAPALTPAPSGVTVLAASVAGTAGPTAQTTLVSTKWGTELEVTCRNMPESGVITLWIVDTSGKATQVASWSGTSDGTASLSAASWITVADMQKLEVRSGEAAIAEAAVSS